MTLKNLTMMSDILARNVLKDKDVCEYVLGILLDDKSVYLEEVNVQADYRSLHGRGVVLDCVAGDDTGRIFNVEIQQDNEGAHPKRARYHLGAMDTNILQTGESFDRLPETYVIFVTRRDALGLDLPIAHIDRIVRETGSEFGDESHFVYVDSSKDSEDTELGRLMRDFNQRDAKDMQESVLARRIWELKETEKGVEHMCEEMETIRREGRAEGIAEGRAEGIVEGKQEVALSLAKRNKMGAEEIAEIIKVNVKTVREWLSGSASPAK